MKRILALICTAVLIGTIFGGCTSVPKTDKDPTQASSAATEAAATQTAQETQAQTTASATEQKQNDSSIGVLSDYIRNADERVTVLPGGGEKRFRIPEILLDSTDAAAANTAIKEKFGGYIEDPDAHNYVSKLDYEAYLYDKFLSVYVKCSVDGGNSYGQCYCFDVTTGKELDGETLCSMTDRSYETAIDTLTTNLTSYYDEKYSKLPGNDDMRSQTLSSDNIKASKMFLDDAHRLTAMVNIYAAVGGGNWVETIPAE